MTSAMRKPIVIQGGKKTPKEQIREDRDMQEKKSEKEIDKTLKDSFPASDPPSH